MEEVRRPKNLRTILLALPVKRRITRKYVPPVYVPGVVHTGVKPGAISGEPQDNWRINQLSQPNERMVTGKYVYVPQEGVGSGVSAATLAGQGTSRSEHLSRPNMRYLEYNKKAYSYMGNPFLKRIDNTLKQSWNSIYNFYRKQTYEIQKKKRAARKKAREEAKRRKLAGKGGKPKSEKELKEEREKRMAEWCALKAEPKKIPPPPPLPPRKVADLAAMAEKIELLSVPRVVTKRYIRPSLDSTYVDPNRVSPAAQAYEPSDRIRELCRNPPYRLIKEYIPKPGAVKRSALTCTVSPRFAELAVPKKKAAEKDNDLKENPFSVSPNALKYVATARIQELAKPTER